MQTKPVICFVAGSAGDWGGASRVLFTNIRGLDLGRISPLVLLPREGPIVEELARLKVPYRVWGDLQEPTDLFAYLRAFFRALRFFRREKVALIHLNLRPWRPAEVLAAKALGIPVVVHYHLVNLTRTPTDAIARAGVAVSEFVRGVSQPVELEKFVVHNPVDLARFSNGRSRRGDFGIDSEKVVVTFLGQIRDIKGVQDFIKMARMTKDERIVFLIAGECRDPKEFPGAYTEADLDEMIGGDARIRYTGYVDRVEDVYVSSDIVVVPSRWQEPLGLIAIEAAACGKPVVATRVGGIPEVVLDGVTGYLVEPQDIEQMARCVQELVNDPLTRRALGDAAHARIKNLFTERPIRQFEDLLLRLACE